MSADTLGRHGSGSVVDFEGSNPDNPTMTTLAGGSLSIVPVALLVAVGVFFGLAAVVAIFVVIVVANRADPDPSGRRPLAVYLFGVSFFSLFIVLFGTFAIVLGLVQLVGSHPGVTGAFSQVKHPVGDSVARTVVLGGIIVSVAGLLLQIHGRRAMNLPEVAHNQPGPVARVAQSYAAAVSFVSIFIAAVSLIVFVYQAFRILAPGVFELSGSRVAAARVLLSALYLTFASAAIVLAHARLLPDQGWGPLRTAGAPVTPPMAPPTAPPAY